MNNEIQKRTTTKKKKKSKFESIDAAEMYNFKYNE